MSMVLEVNICSEHGERQVSIGRLSSNWNCQYSLFGFTMFATHVPDQICLGE